MNDIFDVGAYVAWVITASEWMYRQATDPWTWLQLVIFVALYIVANVAARAIRGHVTDVGGKVVTVSVGSADGVKMGMVFVIHRGDQYVGDLTVTMVDPNQCAGRISLSALPTQVGDQIADQASLSASRG